MKIENIKKAEELLKRRQNIKELLEQLKIKENMITRVHFFCNTINIPIDISTTEIENEMLIPSLQKKLNVIEKELQTL